MPSHIVKAMDAMKEVDTEYEHCLQVLEELTNASRVDGLAIDKLKQVLTVASDRARDKQRKARQVEKYLGEKVQVILDRSKSSKLSVKRRVKLASQPEPPAEAHSAAERKVGRRSKGRKRKAETCLEPCTNRKTRRNLTLPSSSTEAMSNSSYVSRSSEDFGDGSHSTKGSQANKRSNDDAGMSNNVEARSRFDVGKVNDMDGWKNHSSKMLKVIDDWKLKCADIDKVGRIEVMPTDETDAGKFEKTDAGNKEIDAGKFKEAGTRKAKEIDARIYNSPDARKDAVVDACNFSPLKEVQHTVKKRGWKRRKVQDEAMPSQDHNEELDEPKYCICNEMSYGDMIGCDNDLCPMEWFHFKCVQLSSKPRGKWYCPRCRGDRPNVMKPREVIIQELEQYNREKED
ncbi:unnamed protein product [Allacma fusca]|uniref:PHD-type domain-containing protein n=1 Tax=Allacma fusca TaxID=39272 RepID=A0A8J2JGS8_9HEXA|nr:unnamed protein product [Allacma fusca]